MKSSKHFILLLVLIILTQFTSLRAPLEAALPAAAQAEQPASPYYLVQEGDTLWENAPDSA